MSTNLDKAGAQTDERRYVVVDDGLRTDALHVWAADDVVGRHAAGSGAPHRSVPTIVASPPTTLLAPRFGP